MDVANANVRLMDEMVVNLLNHLLYVQDGIMRMLSWLADVCMISASILIEQ